MSDEQDTNILLDYAPKQRKRIRIRWKLILLIVTLAGCIYVMYPMISDRYLYLKLINGAKLDPKAEYDRFAKSLSVQQMSNISKANFREANTLYRSRFRTSDVDVEMLIQDCLAKRITNNQSLCTTFLINWARYQPDNAGTPSHMLSKPANPVHVSVRNAIYGLACSTKDPNELRGITQSFIHWEGSLSFTDEDLSKLQTYEELFNVFQQEWKHTEEWLYVMPQPSVDKQTPEKNLAPRPIVLPKTK